MARNTKQTGRVLAACAVAAALTAAGCGGSSSSGSATGAGNTGTPSKSAKQGGSVTYLSSGDVDYLDPGQTYYTFGYMVEYAVNRSLYSFTPQDSSKPVPDLADGDPQISADNKTITVKLKPGVRYAKPVDREVTSKDVKYAIERAFTSNVPNGYATSYFSEIEGAPSTPPKITALKPFPGLQTPDDHTLVIKLTKPVAQRIAAALVMPITVPVPEEYARKFDEKSPTDYDQYVAFTGPYMVKHDLKTGKVTGRQPGKSIAIVRNPNWDKSTDFRPAYLDSINIEEGNNDLTISSRRTLNGQALMCCDTSQPPASVLQRALTRYKAQLGRVPGGGTHWVALNTTIKPFDNLNVRKAILAGFDRDALRRTAGGAAIGPIAQTYIPPGLPGFEQSGGEKGFDDLDFMQHPTGDPALAAKYMNAAAKEGVPVKDGKYAGGEKLLMIATNAEPGVKTAQVAEAELAKLGFKLNFREVPQDTLYTRFCNVPKQKVAICPNVGWFKDFQDAESMLEPTFDGKAIKPAGNSNWSQLDDPAINQAMVKAALIPAGKARDQAWADINHQIAAQAPAIPFVWDDNFQLASNDVQGVMNRYFTTWDLSYSSIK